MILGLDIGASSVGWALVEPPREGGRGQIVASGARIFAAGVEGVLESGRDEPRNSKRRSARQQRRQTWRRRRRKTIVFRELQRLGLLPATPVLDSAAIHEAIVKLDQDLRIRDSGSETHLGQQTLLYRLRARAASQRLEPRDVGRALYHLAQRRGFLSNRKTPAKEGEDLGEVKSKIASLDTAINASGAETLGAYFASIDPTEERIRSRWTSREMYEKEFAAIWSQQSRHHPQLTDPARADLHAAIFRQRPLKNQKFLVGKCSLEPGKRRIPLASLAAQRFRLLQQVNHLRILDPAKPERPLSAEERDTLIAALELEGDLTCAASRRRIGIPRTARFSLEEGGEKRLVGNRTNAKMREVVGPSWDGLTLEQKSQLVDDVRSFESAEALRSRAQRRWGMNATAANALANLSLEDGYAAFSSAAVRRLLPSLEAGLSIEESRRAMYPEAFDTNAELALLPPIKSREGFPELRNPAVERALTEVRKVVNAIVRRFGRPELIRIELARDLKRSRKARIATSKRMRDRGDERSAAKARILEEAGIHEPRRADIEKILLAEECSWECPYTGERMSMRDLVGDAPRFDIEHIIPFSRSLDDSFANKTLCLAEENRRRKRNRTPFEAYGSTDTWETILGRVSKMQGSYAADKLRRFEIREVGPEVLEEFAARQLNDTRYAAELAAHYVGRLYGGLSDASGKRRVQASSGGATAFLRGCWGVNKILNDGGEKVRDDHRHHAVDAIVIALTSASEIQQLARAAERASSLGYPRRFEEMPEPWDGFLDDARESIEAIQVSHRPDRRLAGALHDETIYGKERKGPAPKGGQRSVRHVRKPIDSLSKSDLEAIVDPRIRSAIDSKLVEIGSESPAKAFADARSRPTIPGAAGRPQRIDRVRIRKSVNAVPIGVALRERHVAPGSNHHMAIVEVDRGPGKSPAWEAHVVTRLEAHDRHRRGEDLVRRDWGPGRRLLFSLMPGDCVSVELAGKDRTVCVVSAISDGQVEVRRSRDARTATDIKKAGAKGGRLRFGPSALREAHCEKVAVDVLGDVLASFD